MPFFGTGAPNIWTPRQSRRLFRVKTNAVKAHPFIPPPEVPIEGKYAGLDHVSKPKLSETKLSITFQVEDLIKEAVELESGKYGPKPREKVGIALNATALKGGAKDVADANGMAKMIRDWDTSGDGTINKGEFRGKVKKLMVSCQMEDLSTQEMDQLFGELDNDGDGILTTEELKGWLVEWKNMGLAYESAVSIMKEERKAQAAQLRSLADDVKEAHEMEAQHRQAEMARLEFMMQTGNDFEVQLGMACGKRRVKATDFVGMYSTHVEGMSKSDFEFMVHNLIPGVTQAKAHALFEVLDDNGNQFLDLHEASTHLAAFQKKAMDHHREQMRLSHAAQRAKRALETKIKEVKLKHDSIKNGSSTSLALQQIEEVEDARSASDRARDEERAQRIKDIANQALKRLINKKLAMGLSRWQEVAYIMREKMRLMRLAAISLILRPFYKAWNSWREKIREERRLREQMRKGLMMLKSKEIFQAFGGWKKACGLGGRGGGGPRKARTEVVAENNICDALRSCLQKK